MGAKQEAKSVIAQAVGQLGEEKVAQILTSYITKQQKNARVREYVREAKAAGKL